MSETMDEPNFAHTPVVDGCYMIGRRNPKSILQCNTYLRSFQANGESVDWCVDPGSRLDLPVVRRNLLAHLGDIKALDCFSVNHQDPDVVGNIPALTKGNPRLTGIITEDAWRLVRHLNVRPRTIEFANRISGDVLTPGAGARIQMVPTPFCHFRGTIAFYDLESQTLFSGDLFAGLNAPGRCQLFAEEQDWPGIAQFHQIYMPTRAAVQHAILQIRALDPPVKFIAPQHGFLLTGDFMHEVMDRLESIYMGMDLLPEELDERFSEGYRDVADDVIDTACKYMSREEALSVLRQLPPNSELAQCLEVGASDARLNRKGFRVLPMLVDALCHHESAGFRDELKALVLNGCTSRRIPLPQMGVGVEEYQPSDVDSISEESGAAAVQPELDLSPLIAPSVSSKPRPEEHEEEKELPWVLRFLVQEIVTLVALGVLIVIFAYFRVPGMPELLATLADILGIDLPNALGP